MKTNSKMPVASGRLLLAGVLAGATAGVAAVPSLQLGISGGTYDAGTQTVISAGPVFTLYAFGHDATDFVDDYFISAAITPAVGPAAANLGSFEFAGNTINVTADMDYGTPPLDPVLDALYGDLPGHSIFPTYFSEFQFNFNANDIASFTTANVQDNPGLTGLNLNATGPVVTSGADGLYYAAFNVDVSNLAAGYAIHFDLYNSDVRNCHGQENCSTVVSVDDFAPFSHDAQSSSSTSSSNGGPGSSSGQVPEPGSTSLALLGLMLLAGGFRSRRKNLNS